MLLFFTTQSFLVQTHLHDLSKSFAAATTTTQASSPLKSNAPVDADKCLLCQEYSHSGVFVLPAAIATLAPTAAVSLLPLALAPFHLAYAASHDWQGRAPPNPV